MPTLVNNFTHTFFERSLTLNKVSCQFRYIPRSSEFCPLININLLIKKSSLPISLHFIAKKIFPHAWATFSTNYKYLQLRTFSSDNVPFLRSTYNELRRFNLFSSELVVSSQFWYFHIVGGEALAEVSHLWSDSDWSRIEWVAFYAHFFKFVKQ